ncbi:MAG: 4-hydroxy-2-oxovalerate aldolase [Acidobacteria bacterium]|nr:4-hydroxy-2-oxovalerate aldolase [Acidobacteriota bacterium]
MHVPRITDVTLRDGSHAIAHQFRVEDILTIARGLDEAGVSVIEVSHGDGLGGSSLQYGFSAEPETSYIATAAKVIKRAKLAVLLLPGIGTKEDLRTAADLGASVARIATHATEADISEQHMQLAKKMGMEVVGFLMMAHMESPETLLRQARLMEGYGADCVYVVDSAGAMTPREAADRVAALRGGLSVQVGYHAHNNLSLAIANSLAALEQGAQQIDAATCGFGAGAGNAATEVLVAVLDKIGVRTSIDLYKIMDVAEELVRPVMRRPLLVDRPSLSLGYAGVYSSFLLHAERAARRFGVDARDVLIELGRRRIVGGQEDMIVDVAVEIANGQAQRKVVASD